MQSKTELLREAATLINKWLDDLHKENAELTEEIEILLASQAPGSELSKHHSLRQFNQLHKNQVSILELEMALAQIPIERPQDINTLQAYIDRLETDSQFREDESYAAELGRLAQVKAKAELMEYHIYADGVGDFPILCAESMEILAEQERKECQIN